MIDILKENKKGNDKMSLKRVASLLGIIILSWAMVNASYKAVSECISEMMFWYSIGITILVSPMVAIDLLNIWRGGQPIKRESNDPE